MTSSNESEDWVGAAVTPETKITSEMNKRLAGPNEFDDPEPVFTFRGKDALALDAIWFYERACRRVGLSDQADEVGIAIAEIEAWQARNPDKVKLPDHEHQPARRNPHCSNCGDTRGGPFGHEANECTFDSKKG